MKESTKEDIVKRIIDGNLQLEVYDNFERVEIFCNRKYKGYSVRGFVQAVQDSGSVHDKTRGLFGYIKYLFAMTALVNTAYQERVRKGSIRSFERDGAFEHWNAETMFAWKTPKQFVDAKKRQMSSWWNQIKHKGYVPKDADQVYGQQIIVIDLHDAGIKESQYLDESIEAKKDIILLDMDLLVGEMTLHDGQEMRDYYNRIYTIPSFWCPIRTNELTSADFANWFDDLYEILYSNLGYDYLKKREYNTILESVGNLGYEWLRKNTVNKRYLKRLSRISGETGDRTYPLTNFCWKFLDDLIDDLTSQKQIVQCQFCRDFFIYQRRWPTKKFCSLRFEGKNCRKDYNNRLDYRRHPEERKLKAREYQRKRRAEKKEHDRLKAEKKKEENRKYQREYRALLKEYGVKK